MRKQESGASRQAAGRERAMRPPGEAERISASLSASRQVAIDGDAAII
jgi:hypothetical protein